MSVTLAPELAEVIKESAEPTGEDMAEARRRVAAGKRLACEYYARCEAARKAAEA